MARSYSCLWCLAWACTSSKAILCIWRGCLFFRQMSTSWYITVTRWTQSSISIYNHGWWTTLQDSGKEDQNFCCEFWWNLSVTGYRYHWFLLSETKMYRILLGGWKSTTDRSGDYFDKTVWVLVTNSNPNFSWHWNCSVRNFCTWWHNAWCVPVLEGAQVPSQLQQLKITSWVVTQSACYLVQALSDTNTTPSQCSVFFFFPRIRHKCDKRRRCRATLLRWTVRVWQHRCTVVADVARSWQVCPSLFYRRQWPIIKVAENLDRSPMKVCWRICCDDQWTASRPFGRLRWILDTLDAGHYLFLR